MYFYDIGQRVADNRKLHKGNKYKLSQDTKLIEHIEDAVLNKGKLPDNLVGRLKELIIRGGENIVPNEIISAICEEDYVADAKVYGVPDEFFGERVAAAIVLNDSSKYDEEKLKDNLKSKLAKFKIPDFFVIYDTFPTLSNGKVDGVRLKNEIIEKCKKI